MNPVFLLAWPVGACLGSLVVQGCFFQGPWLGPLGLPLHRCFLGAPWTTAALAFLWAQAGARPLEQRSSPARPLHPPGPQLHALLVWSWPFRLGCDNPRPGADPTGQTAAAQLLRDSRAQRLRVSAGPAGRSGLAAEAKGHGLWSPLDPMTVTVTVTVTTSRAERKAPRPGPSCCLQPRPGGACAQEGPCA